MGLVRGYDSDTVSETLRCETACLAHEGDLHGDGNANDDDDSVITDDGEDYAEATAVDDQQPPQTPARDTTRLTSYRANNNDSSDNTQSPSPQIKARYCFSIGSTGAPSTSRTGRPTGNSNTTGELGSYATYSILRDYFMEQDSHFVWLQVHQLRWNIKWTPSNV